MAAASHPETHSLAQHARRLPGDQIACLRCESSDCANAAAFNFGNLTLYGQVGWIQQFAGYYGGGGGGTYGSEYNFGLLFAQIEARYFLTPNTKLAANVGLVNGQIWGYYGSENWLTYGVEVEHKMTSGPLSVFARAQGFNGTGEYDVNGYKLQAGIKLHWGAGTLLDQDRNGATLKVMEDLAPIGDVRAFD